MQIPEKTFIFITGPIVRIGGSQLYVLRKMDWLRSEGWRVMVFSTERGELKIPGLKEFEPNIHEFLSVPFQFFSKRKRNRLIELLVAEIGVSKEIVIQSHSLNLMTWGEALAGRLSGRHIAHLLLENIVCRHSVTEKLLRFKLDNGSLFSIKAECLNRFFRHEIAKEKVQLTATGCSSGNVLDYDCPQIGQLGRADFSILVLGRLEKPYIPHAFDAVAEFAKRHPDKRINLIALGCAIKGITIKNLKSRFDNCHNASVVFLGELFPVPKRLFEQVDVSIASAGCARMVYNERALCISIDGHDNKAIGILGVTTHAALFRESEPQADISELLEEVLINARYTRNDIDEIDKVATCDFSEHRNVLNAAWGHNYFDFDGQKLSRYEMLMRRLVGVFGDVGYRFFVRCFRYGRCIFYNADACFNRG